MNDERIDQCNLHHELVVDVKISDQAVDCEREAVVAHGDRHPKEKSNSYLQIVKSLIDSPSEEQNQQSFAQQT